MWVSSRADINLVKRMKESEQRKRRIREGEKWR